MNWVVIERGDAFWLGLRGKPRETSVKMLNKDINRAKSIKRDILLPTFKKKEDFEEIRWKARDRKVWRRTSEIICRAAEAETTWEIPCRESVTAII